MAITTLDNAVFHDILLSTTGNQTGGVQTIYLDGTLGTIFYTGALTLVDEIGGTAALSVAALTGIITMSGGATLDNTTSATVLNLTETTVRVTGDFNVTGAITAGTLLGTLWSDTADGTIPARRLVMIDSAGYTLVATAASHNVIGVNNDNTSRAGTETVNIAIGKVTVVAASPVKAGTALKCADNGRVTRLLDADTIGGTIHTAAACGIAYGNQPTNDTITFVSSSAVDAAVAITFIGTTQATDTVVVETKNTNGVTPVDTTKTDWGQLLAVKKPVTTGDIAITEKSGGLAITTVLAAATTSGVLAVTATAQGSYNGIPSLESDAGTTKQVGLQYTATDGATVAYDSQAINGTAVVPMNAAALLVTEVYVGDLEAARTITVKVTATEEDENHKIGKALATAAAAATCVATIYP